MNLFTLINTILVQNALITAFAAVGVIICFSYYLSSGLTSGRVHGSAIAILTGLLLATLGGLYTGGQKGIADIELFSGFSAMGSPMLLGLTIVATAFGIDVRELQQAGLHGILALLAGIVVPFTIGALAAFAFGYRDAVSLTTIGAGAATYLIGPITGDALGASSDVMALSVAAGLLKSILTMIVTPLVAGFIGLDNPRAALIFGGLLGTTSGVAAGLAATDPKLVPYGAITATFYTGIGCFLGPSLFFSIIQQLV